MATSIGKANSGDQEDDEKPEPKAMPKNFPPVFKTAPDFHTCGVSSMIAPLRLRPDDWPDRRAFTFSREGFRRPSKAVDAPLCTQSAPFVPPIYLGENTYKQCGGHAFDTAASVDGLTPSFHGRTDAGLRIEVSTNGRPVIRSGSISKLATPARTLACSLRRPGSERDLLSMSKAMSSVGRLAQEWRRVGAGSKSNHKNFDGFGERLYMNPGGLPRRRHVWDPWDDYL
eukprot:TRINITY_DN61235_c0_g1_i1.p1 TRINITY_DN61235_c0_g1~~TRINITY_DN61235_c0_g1_i1.p1  ORF type:complete len:252 (-),score=21.39 TRINITY_DN61235_c0_g1_i1:114-797(-)